MDTEELAEIEELYESSFPGVWEADKRCLVIAGEWYKLPCSEEDVKFIAASHQFTPRLLAEVRRLQTELKAAKE